MLINFLLSLHFFVAIVIVILILLQQGKGASMGAAFGGGGGSSQSLFGARGSANFLSRSTSLLATVFFITSLALAFLYTKEREATSVTQSSVTIDSEENQGDVNQKEESDIPLAPKQ